MHQIKDLDRLIEALCADCDAASLAELQQALIDRANLLESALWQLYRKAA